MQLWQAIMIIISDQEVKEMKRICSAAMLTLLLFASCGQTKEPDARQTASSDFDSYICFSVKSGVTDAELDEIAHILENRIADGYSMLNYQLIPEYDTDHLRFEFDYIEGTAERFTETILEKNILGFRKGSRLDDELLLTNDNVKSAYKTLEDNGGDKLWSVFIVLDEDGSKIFADATGELAGTGTPISVWLDDELLYAPIVNAAITDGRVILSGNFDEQSSDELARKIRSMPLPYDVTIDMYEFGGSE